MTFMLVKDGAGLGFSLEGGKDSPVGDKPLVIKKIFTGTFAFASGRTVARLTRWDCSQEALPRSAVT